jgi:hypothetical protein
LASNIRAGFAINISDGIKCRRRIVISLEFKALYEFEYEFMRPWFMVEYIYSEYAAVIKVRRASGIIRFIEM